MQVTDQSLTQGTTRESHYCSSASAAVCLSSCLFSRLSVCLSAYALYLFLWPPLLSPSKLPALLVGNMIYCARGIDEWPLSLVISYE